MTSAGQHILRQEYIGRLRRLVCLRHALDIRLDAFGWQQIEQRWSAYTLGEASDGQDLRPHDCHRDPGCPEHAQSWFAISVCVCARSGSVGSNPRGSYF